MKTKKKKSGKKQSKLMTAALKTVDTIVISLSILFAALYQIKELSWLSFPTQLAGLVVSPKVKKYTKNWFILITVLRKSFSESWTNCSFPWKIMEKMITRWRSWSEGTSRNKSIFYQVTTRVRMGSEFYGVKIKRDVLLLYTWCVMW